VEKDVLDIAISELRSCYGDVGIFAGLRQFKDYWARDSFFASYGALAVKDYDIVHKNLNLFLRHQDKHGQIPLRIGVTAPGVVLAYVGIRTRRRPIYSIDKSKDRPTDQNSLFIIVAREYVRITKDTSFVTQNIRQLEKAMEWNFGQDIDGDLLVEESCYCNWADSVKKSGKVLYTNVCHCHALKCLSELLHMVQDNNSSYYHDLYIKVKKKINSIFWNSEHYMDWIDGDIQYNFFSSDGNFLAVIWDVADRHQAIKIEEAANIFGIGKTPSECVHPSYPRKLIAPEIRLIGISDYHNGMSWIWLGAIQALAMHKLGMNKEAKALMKKIARMVVKYDGVYEVYENDGRPVKRFLYKAEKPLAWSCGLFIYASNEIL
jgi:glycogen debranching enzyme